MSAVQEEQQVIKLWNRATVNTYGWPRHVVPNQPLKAFIESKIDLLNAEYTPPDDSAITNLIRDGDGWRTLLAERTSRSLGLSFDACTRRIYDTFNPKPTMKAINANFADACCIAVGVHIDVDTDIPILPGSGKLADEMIMIRAEAMGLTLLPRDRLEHASQLMRLCRLIVNYQHHIPRLVPLAPFDCLRPY